MQRAAGELYVRGLLTDGQRKSMQPMAARLGVDQAQRLQHVVSHARLDLGLRRSTAERGAVVSPPVAAGSGGAGGLG